MVQPLSILNVSDNSGAKTVQCIKVLGKHKRSSGSINDFVVVSVKTLRKKGNLKIKRKEICLGLIIKLKKKVKRSGGFFFNFDKNSVILLDKSFKPIGTRIFGSVSKELKKHKKFKIISLSSNLL